MDFLSQKILSFWILKKYISQDLPHASPTPASLIVVDSRNLGQNFSHEIPITNMKLLLYFAELWPGWWNTYLTFAYLYFLGVVPNLGNRTIIDTLARTLLMIYDLHNYMDLLPFSFFLSAISVTLLCWCECAKKESIICAILHDNWLFGFIQIFSFSKKIHVW